MQQGFELRGHHQVDQEDREGERERQRTDRFVQLLALAADAHGDVGAQWRLGHHRFDFPDRVAQVDVAQVGRHDRHPSLVGAMDFAGAGGGDHVRDRSQFHRRALARVDDQPANVIQRGAVAFLRTHQHVDLSITEAVARGHVAAHLVDHHVGDLPGGESQRSRAFLVEDDVDFGEALLHRRLHVRIVRIRAQHLRQTNACGANGLQVTAFHFDFQRRREAEQFGPGEVDLRRGPGLHGLAQAFGERAFGIVVGHHHRQLADVLAAFGRARVQPRAGTGYAIQHAHTVILRMRGLHRADHRIGLRERRARRQLGGHFETILRELRDEVGAQQRNRQHRQHECDRCNAKHRNWPRQRRRQDAHVSPFGAMVGRHRQVAGLAHDRADERCDRTPQAHDDPCHAEKDATERCAESAATHGHGLLPTRFRCPTRMRQLFGKTKRRTAFQRAEHRDQGHRDDQRHRDGNRHRQRLVAEQLAGNPLHEHQRQEHRDRGQGGGDHRHADLARAGDRGIQDPQPAFARLGDRFQHHDRVIHHQTGGQCQAAQRHHVEAQPQAVHEEERGDDRHRQRQADDERAPAIAQEQEDDQESPSL